MPFQSEKQRRYMHANLPDIAKRWERDYSNGGIAELNQELNSLPEYYMPFPAAHGGLIPAHEAGIYGLAEGGNIRLQPHTASDLLVQETSSGERPKYQPPGHVDAPAPSSSGGGADEPSWGGESYDPPSAPPAETVERDDGDAREKYISEQYKVPKQIDDPDYDEPDRAHEKLTQREIKQRIKELKDEIVHFGYTIDENDEEYISRMNEIKSLGKEIKQTELNLINLYKGRQMTEDEIFSLVRNQK